MPATHEPVSAVFRAAWMLFLARTVMYGDPQLVIQACFFLLVTSIALTVLPRLRTLLRRLAVAQDGGLPLPRTRYPQSGKR